MRLTQTSPKVAWESPTQAETKINFDAAFDHSTFRSNSGMVARNAFGIVLASKLVFHDNVSTTFATEAPACMEAVKIGFDLGLNGVIMEADALMIIKKCRAINKDKSGIGPYIQNIKMLSQPFTLIRF